MINLELSNEDMKALRGSIHSQMEATADFFSNASSHEFIEASKELHLLAKLRFAIDQQIDEGDAATNEYAPSSY